MTEIRHPPAVKHDGYHIGEINRCRPDEISVYRMLYSSQTSGGTRLQRGIVPSQSSCVPAGGSDLRQYGLYQALGSRFDSFDTLAESSHIAAVAL